MEKSEIGIYIHIPFCKRKCYYCDFISFAGKEEWIEDYVEAVIKEIKREDLENYHIKTIYLGGGTPSILESKWIGKILKTIPFEKDIEITIEINPGTCSREKLQDYFAFGVNRLSIGLQSTSDRLLKQIGRIHNFQEFLEMYEMAREIGFQNINVDLMLGLPNQTLEDVLQSVNTVILLNPEHISLYSFILEEGTKIDKMIKQNKAKMIEEELERKMYWETKKMLEEKGYLHYEISNFAKQGYESKHNLDCWNQEEYFGFGMAAHSYFDKIRCSNTDDMKEYLSFADNMPFKKNKIIHERQTIEDEEKEYMILGLRKLQGVSIEVFQEKFQKNPISLYESELEKLSKIGLIKVKNDYIRLTKKGLDFANLVWEEFI